MDISIAATPEVNPESTGGKKLQILKMGDPVNSVEKEKKATDTGHDADNGNIFSQILSQQITKNVQSGESANSTEITAKQYPLGDVDPSEISKKYPLGDVDPLEIKKKYPLGDVDPSEIKTKYPLGDVDPSEIKNKYPLGDVDPTDIRNNYPMGDVDPSEIKTKYPLGDVDPTDISKKYPLGDVDPTDISKKYPLGDVDPTDINKKYPLGDVDPSDISKKYPLGDIEKNVAKTSLPAGIAVAKQITGDDLNTNAKVSSTGDVQDQKRNQHTSNETQTEQEKRIHHNVQNQNASEISNKNSTIFDKIIADKQASKSINDTQNIMAGKIAASMSESAAVADKVKTELKGKTMLGENKLEINSLNSTTLSDVGSAKTAAKDISPAQLINRVAAAFNENLASEGGRVKITLAPPSLGKLEMDVTVHNNSVKVMLIADSKDVQQILSGNLDSLKGSLQTQGLTIERCDVMMQNRHDQGTQNFSQQSFNQQQRDIHHHEGGESLSQNAREIASRIHQPINEAAWRMGNISLFV